MSYTAGSTLGRLRELIGDLEDDELFSDVQLNDYLTACNDVLGYAAARALRRTANDPTLLRKKYGTFGRMDASTIASFQRNLLDQARDLETSELSATTPVDVSPTADSGDAYISTDSDGWHEETDLDTLLLSQEEKR